ncbi:hypothetical protein PLIP_a1323 [Pseudoalteromonas lipolytica LMEB 39]|nr:hypothetical protein [Pseudoalteromonas lipolytica LMEB 39]
MNNENCLSRGNNYLQSLLFWLRQTGYNARNSILFFSAHRGLSFLEPLGVLCYD